MRIIRSLLILMIALLPLPAFAQDVSTEQSDIDWVKVESTGTMSEGKNGGLQKNLWQDQKRTEIETGIKNLPNGQRLRSALSLQRRLLMTGADASLIENDIEPSQGNDLLIQRINKLMDMGLYDSAWELYTQKAEDPYDVSIAQLGMLLLVMKNDLATACLEEKVFSVRYPQDAFFKTLDAACVETLGGTETPAFPDSEVLQAVYHKENYSVSAATPQVIDKMSDLERALVLANGKIRYDGLTGKILRDTPSALVSLYLMDRNLPESAKAMIKSETDIRGLSWHIAAVAKDPEWKKAKDVGKDKEAQWPLVEANLKRITNPADLAPYVDMLVEATPANLSTESLMRTLGAFLSSSRPLPEFWVDAAQKRAAEKPLIYIYLQMFHSLTPTPEAEVSLENLKKGFEGLKPEDSGQILAIIDTLDKDNEKINTLAGIYEKHSVLTSENNYVMHSEDKNEPETAPDQKHLGITVLSVLNSLAARPDNMYSGLVVQALKSMLNVGLIEDAKLIGAETIASVLNKY